MDTRRLIACVLLGLGGLVVACTPGPGGEANAPPPGAGKAAGFVLSSTAFSEGDRLPARFATERAGGQNVSPPLSWTNPPPGTRSFAIECVDLDPSARSWVHWLVVDISADWRGLQEGASSAWMPAGARQLKNGFGDLGWGGPQPPSGTHEYRLVIYALDTDRLDVPESASLDEFRAAVEEHVLGSASLTGTFER